jgi:hypothetical protein
MEALVLGQAGVEVGVEADHQSREKTVALCHLTTKTWPTFRVGISI